MVGAEDAVAVVATSPTTRAESRTHRIRASLAPFAHTVKAVSRTWVIALVLLAVGCSGGTKVGGSAGHVTVLTIANHEGEGRDLGDYISAVNRLSNGSLRLRL